MKLFAHFALACLLANQLSGAASDRNLGESVLVVYVNFDIETYSPISRETIERYSNCAFGAPPLHVLEAINLALSTATSGVFDNSQVRLKVEGLGIGDVYIDRLGGAFEVSTGRELQLGPAAFSTLKDSMSPLDGMSCSRGPRMWPQGDE